MRIIFGFLLINVILSSVDEDAFIIFARIAVKISTIYFKRNSIEIAPLQPNL